MKIYAIILIVFGQLALYSCGNKQESKKTENENQSATTEVDEDSSNHDLETDPMRDLINLYDHFELQDKLDVRDLKGAVAGKRTILIPQHVVEAFIDPMQSEPKVEKGVVGTSYQALAKVKFYGGKTLLLFEKEIVPTPSVFMEIGMLVLTEDSLVTGPFEVAYQRGGGGGDLTVLNTMFDHITVQDLKTEKVMEGEDGLESEMIFLDRILRIDSKGSLEDLEFKDRTSRKDMVLFIVEEDNYNLSEDLSFLIDELPNVLGEEAIYRVMYNARADSSITITTRGGEELFEIGDYFNRIGTGAIMMNKGKKIEAIHYDMPSDFIEKVKVYFDLN